MGYWCHLLSVKLKTLSVISDGGSKHTVLMQLSGNVHVLLGVIIMCPPDYFNSSKTRVFHCCSKHGTVPIMLSWAGWRMKQLVTSVPEARWTDKTGFKAFYCTTGFLLMEFMTFMISSVFSFSSLPWRSLEFMQTSRAFYLLAYHIPMA